MRPNVVGVSVPYGTYSSLEALTPALSLLLDGGACVMLGGALPTYLSEEILRDLDRRLTVVVGEGEEAAVGAIAAWAGAGEIGDVPNLHVALAETMTQTDRAIVDARVVPIPFREHLPEIVEMGAQVFAEASRACSWAACSFCLRGLTDIDGKPREYRRLGMDRLGQDLAALASLGVTALTFADEDFLGGDLDALASFVSELEAALAVFGQSGVKFDVSATIRSIFDESDSPAERSEREELLRRLVSMGLRKVFLGIESGSPTQLRRYTKGHTAEECVAASRAVLESGAQLGLGFIMFDPLCTMEEVVENVGFLLDNDLAQYASGPTSELRLQTGSRYLPILHRREDELGARLYDRNLDRNTLSFSYEYADPAVAELVDAVRRDNERSHALVYRLKGLTRFGDGQILGRATPAVKNALGSYRIETLECLARSATGQGVTYERDGATALTKLARDFLGITEVADNQRPLVRQAVAVAQSFVDEIDAS